jgi:hypothetical protein
VVRMGRRGWCGECEWREGRGESEWERELFGFQRLGDLVYRDANFAL